MDNIADMDAVILAGGLGTRLQPVLSNRPEGLAEVPGKLFLFYQLNQIAACFRWVFLCVSYMAEKVQVCLGKTYGIPLPYEESDVFMDLVSEPTRPEG